MFGVALLTSTLLALADARIYERCELARDLLSLGVRKEHIATWVCIAFHESRFDTAARNPYSGDHGLLQISELYWCGAGKACGLPCSALRDEDISDDVECALRIHEEHTRLQGNGFLAWVVYPQHCKHNAKKYLADCDSSVKSSLVRTHGRARILKSQNQTSTNLPYNHKIDELLPPYLTVGSFLRGSYEKEFEQNYNKKTRVNWLNYKIDNIDDLKLPVFNQKLGERYTTTVTEQYVPSTLSTTTTSTTYSPLRKIKPPSPRRLYIESNSFRRRKNYPIPKSVNVSETTDVTTPPTTLYTNKHSATPSYTSPFSSQSTTQSVTSTTTTTTTIRPSTRHYELSTQNTPVVTKTTKPFIYPTIKSTVSTRISQEPTKITVSTKSTNEKSTVTEKPTISSTVSLIDQKSVTKTTRSPVTLDKSSSTPFAESTINGLTNKPYTRGSEITTKLTSTLSPSSTTRLYEYSTQTKDNRLSSSITTAKPQVRSLWRTSPVHESVTSSTTAKPSTINWRTPWSYTYRETPRVNATTKSYRSSTPSPRVTRDWPRSSSTQLLDSDKRTSQRTLIVQSTTSKPSTTWSTISRSTPSPTTVISTSTKRLVTTTEKPSPTTARTTQSIFDLYLNPTKRPKLPAFSFAPFKNSAFSLRIFSGGTTTSAPSLLKNEEPKSGSGEAAKNQIRRQASQDT